MTACNILFDFVNKQLRRSNIWLEYGSALTFIKTHTAPPYLLRRYNKTWRGDH